MLKFSIRQHSGCNVQQVLENGKRRITQGSRKARRKDSISCGKLSQRKVRSDKHSSISFGFDILEILVSFLIIYMPTNVGMNC